MSIFFNLLTFLPIFLLNCSPTSFEGSEQSIKKWNHKDFKTACVNFHNFLRVVHNAAPLKWDNTLEDLSQAWAQHLNIIQTVDKHYKGAQEIGTNIYQKKNPRDIDLICLYAVEYWYREIEKYDFDNPGFSEKTGHFTAMVWRATEKFGLGEEGQAGGSFYVVAAYDPRGNMKGGYEENVHRLKRIPSSCISKITKMEHYQLLMDHLKVDPTNNKFVYPSNETCILPTRDNPKSQTPHGTNGAQTGTAGNEHTGEQKTPGTSSTTGTEMGRLSQGVLRKTPNEVLAVPVSGPVGAEYTPEITLGQPERAPQNAPKVIFIPAAQLQPATGRLPVAPDESTLRPQTTTQLRLHVNSTTTVPHLNTTVYLLSSSVTPAVSISLSTISKSTIT